LILRWSKKVIHKILLLTIWDSRIARSTEVTMFSGNTEWWRFTLEMDVSSDSETWNCDQAVIANSSFAFSFFPSIEIQNPRYFDLTTAARPHTISASSPTPEVFLFTDKTRIGP
jgi:hypothetical protein